MAAIPRPPTSLELAADNLRLRPWQSGDADALYEAARESTATVGQWLPWLHADYTREDSERWIAHCQSAWKRGELYAFGIFDLQGRLLGSMGLNRLDPQRLNANLGYWVREQEQRKGIASRAVRAMAAFGFEALGLIRVEIVTAIDNLASRRVAERVGAHFDGTSPNRIVHRQRPAPAAVYSLLPPDDDDLLSGPVIEEGWIRLRPFQLSDLDALYDALHESVDTIGRWQDWMTPHYSREDARRWIARSRLAWRGTGDECALAITDRYTSDLVGSIAINHWQPDYGAANLGYWVRQTRQGQGAASAAVRLLARHALQSTELQRLEIVAAVNNGASRRAAENAGAKFECIARNRLILHGQSLDAAMYSIVASDVI